MTVDVDGADALRLLDLPSRGSADEGDLDASGGWGVDHVDDAKCDGGYRTSVELRIRCVVESAALFDW
jgi:hypothetical protein